MRISSDHYSTYHNPERCKFITKYCSSLRHTGTEAEYLVGKRLTSIIAKYYKDHIDTGYLCEEWENNPDEFIAWFISHDPTGRGIMKRLDREKGFSPSNLTIFPKAHKVA